MLKRALPLVGAAVALLVLIRIIRALNPEIQRLLDAFPDDGPPAHEVPIEQARMAHITETKVLAGEGVPVDHVADDGDRGVCPCGSTSPRARAGPSPICTAAAG